MTAHLVYISFQGFRDQGLENKSSTNNDKKLTANLPIIVGQLGSSTRTFRPKETKYNTKANLRLPYHLYKNTFEHHMKISLQEMKTW